MNNARAATCAVAVMAKAPQPGLCKTRLLPLLSPEQGACLSAAFLRDITENIVKAGETAAIQGYVAYAPAGLEPMLNGHFADGVKLLLADGAAAMPEGVEGFGCCLLQTVQSLLREGYGAVCVVNSDSPNLPTCILTRAAAALNLPGERAVLGPCEDGGYYLLGLKTAHAHLFTDISWSTERVAEQTRQRAKQVGLHLEVLPQWYDVDDPPSLHRLIADLAAPLAPGSPLSPYAAPTTAACLSTFGHV